MSRNFNIGVGGISHQTGGSPGKKTGISCLGGSASNTHGMGRFVAGGRWNLVLAKFPLLLWV